MAPSSNFHALYHHTQLLLAVNPNFFAPVQAISMTALNGWRVALKSVVVVL
jgi:hypothetical protein